MNAYQEAKARYRAAMDRLAELEDPRVSGQHGIGSAPDPSLLPKVRIHPFWPPAMVASLWIRHPSTRVIGISLVDATGQGYHFSVTRHSALWMLRNGVAGLFPRLYRVLGWWLDRQVRMAAQSGGASGAVEVRSL